MRALASAVLTAALLAGCAGPLAGEQPPREGTTRDGAAEEKGPAWSFVDTEGVTRSRDAPPGNATVVFFMASWCGTCRSKAPMLADVHHAYADRGVRFFSVSWDSTDDAESLRAWSAARGNPWPHGVDPGLGIQKTFGVTAQSSVLVLDRDGYAVKLWGYGGVTDAGLRAALDEALAV